MAGGDWESHRRHWDRSVNNGQRYLEAQHNRNGARFGDGRGGGRDGNNGGGGGALEGHGYNNNPPTKTGRKLEAEDRLVGREVGLIMDWGVQIKYL